MTKHREMDAPLPHRRSPVEPSEPPHFSNAFTPPAGRADIASPLKKPWEKPPLYSHLLVSGPPLATTSATSRTPRPDPSLSLSGTPLP
ncbi:hypothetical protein [Streptomyces californicus]|uniref:hypothetical protein n=1 Tax=Streptomyces californicus TaxID=67351 RepID=UPI0037A929E3